MLAHEVGQPVGATVGRARATFEVEHERAIRHLVAAHLIGVVALDLAAGLRKQGRHEQQLVQITLVECGAGSGPVGVERIVRYLIFLGALSQLVHVLDQHTEIGVLLAALLRVLVVLQQAQPQPMTNHIQRRHIDEAQAEALLEALFVELFAQVQLVGKGEDLRTRRDVEQPRRLETLRPDAAVNGGNDRRCRLRLKPEQTCTHC